MVKTPPRIFPECKNILQLSPDKRVGDWYLFENHIEIRVYGVEVQPFLLPRFLTPRIFSLEFIRKRLNSDYIHFVSKKHKVRFKLKKEVDLLLSTIEHPCRMQKSFFRTWDSNKVKCGSMILILSFQQEEHGLDQLLININQSHNWSCWPIKIVGKMCKEFYRFKNKFQISHQNH
jgi:hypothetical protein